MPIPNLDAVDDVTGNLRPAYSNKNWGDSIDDARRRPSRPQRIAYPACGHRMYPDLQAGTAAAATPTGQALRVPGGYRVSGRFPFASGCHHCEWVWLGCVVMTDGVPVADANGVPETRQCMVNLSQCEILD